jgi:outer membrane protein assembly factor BamE
MRKTSSHNSHHFAAPMLLLPLLLLAGCSSEGDRKLPGVYRVDVQQGNIIDQEMLDKLRPGMDKNQVRFIMGTPAITDPFHSDRWDYVFTLSKSGRTRQQRHIVVHFQDNKLVRVEGDVVTGVRKSPDDLEARAASVEVPLERNKPGVFSRMFNALPFVGDEDKPKKRAPAGDEDGEDAGDGAATEETPAGEEPGASANPEPQTNPDLPSP